MIALSSVDPVRLAAALAEGASFTLVPSALAGAPDDEAGIASHAADPTGARRLRSALSERELARRFVAIRRAARAHMADGGVHTLWLGLGMLTWRAAEDDAAPGDAAPVGRELHVDQLHGDLARDTAAGDAAPGDTAAGDTALGDTAAGDTARGDAAPGDTAAGDAARGGTAAGDTAAGDAALRGTAAGEI